VYETVEEAIDEAQAGDTVILLQDHAEDEIYVSRNVTLDLNGYKLTTTDLIAPFESSEVIDSSDGKGLLIVGRDDIAIDESNSYMSVWSEGEGYRFTKVTMKQNLKPQGENSALFRFYIDGNDPACAMQQAWVNGGADNGNKVIVKLEWTDLNGNYASREYVYGDDKLAEYAANWTGNEFRLTVNGLSNVSELKVTAMVTGDCDVTICGETKAINTNN
jgi:hypothetical protein